LKCGLKLSEIKNVDKELDESDWSKKEFLLLSAVDQLIAKKRLDNNLYRDLRSYFSDKQIMDIVAIHGMYIILGCMINIWGLTLEDDIAQRLPESITETQFLS
jgi:hypothetical protein